MNPMGSQRWLVALCVVGLAACARQEGPPPATAPQAAASRELTATPTLAPTSRPTPGPMPSPILGATVRGRVVEGYGAHRPVLGLPLWLGSASEGVPATRTGGNGEFALADVPPGLHQVVNSHLFFDVTVPKGATVVDVGTLGYPLIHPPLYYYSMPAPLPNLEELLARGQVVEFAVCQEDSAWRRPSEEEQREVVWSKRPFSDLGEPVLRWWFERPAMLYDTVDEFRQSFPDGPSLERLAADRRYLLGTWNSAGLAGWGCAYDAGVLEHLVSRRQLEVWLLGYRAFGVRRLGEHWAVQVGRADGLQVIRFAGEEGVLAVHIVCDGVELACLPERPSPAPPALYDVALPDLTPPRGGWVACLTPERRLALVAPDGSRRVSLDQLGELWGYTWSPDGRWLALTRQGGIRDSYLAVVSLEHSRAALLPDPIRGTTWSQDGRFLGYLTSPFSERGPFPVRLLEMSKGQSVTLTTYPEAQSAEDLPDLCPQASPSSLLPVFLWRNEGAEVDMWDTEAKSELVSFDTAACGCYDDQLWLPQGEGLILAANQVEKEPVWHGEIRRYPVSLAFWRPGMDAPAVVLEAMERQSFHPLRWLPDGRLEVWAGEWQKERYSIDEPAQPRFVAYRFFHVSTEGEMREDDADLPWWAGDGLAARLSEVELPGPEGRLGDWDVAPGGRTVTFTWSWQAGYQWPSAVYVWDGEGEPLRLCDGFSPRWQPIP